MTYRQMASALSLTIALGGMVAYAPSALAQDTADTNASSGQLDEIIVTSQRREQGVQDTSAAISAFSGANLEEERILSFEDLASSATSLSFTALSPLDQEFNIRGITNTRLDSPSADQSIGIFFVNLKNVIGPGICDSVLLCRNIHRFCKSSNAPRQPTNKMNT